VPIFELDQQSLVPIRRQAVAAGVYEEEIESLLWDNLEELTGDNLFRVARQPVLPLGRPDVIALDAAGRIVVIEVKRDVDRHQVAQALEYAGWARGVRLDDLAEKYHGGPGSFWEDWLEFTGSATPVLVQQDPRLMLVARSFEPRTLQALEFLQRHRVPVKLLRVAFYLDEDRRRFLDVEWESEPEVSGAALPAASMAGAVDHREVSLSQVAEIVAAPAELVWKRARKGERHQATLLASGRIRLADGREFLSPSGAAMASTDVVSYNGWSAWRVGDDGPTLDDLRHQVAAAG
jgi:hypothetical protein